MIEDKNLDYKDRIVVFVSSQHCLFENANLSSVLFFFLGHYILAGFKG